MLALKCFFQINDPADVMADREQLDCVMAFQRATSPPGTSADPLEGPSTGPASTVRSPSSRRRLRSWLGLLPPSTDTSTPVLALPRPLPLQSP